MSTWKRGVTLQTQKQNQKPEAGKAANLKLLHQLADGLAPGSDDAGVGPRVQVHVLAHHLLQLGHQLLDGLTRFLHVALVARDHDQVLRAVANTHTHTQTRVTVRSSAVR